MGEVGPARALRAVRRGVAGVGEKSGWVLLDGDEGGESPAASNAAAGSFQKCSCSFSEFQA